MTDSPTPVLYPAQGEPLTESQQRIKRFLEGTRTSPKHEGSVGLPNSAGDGGSTETVFSRRESKQVAECNPVYVAKVYDEPGEARDIIREISDAHRDTVNVVTQGGQFNAKDRADQDRYLAGEFRGLGVAAAQVEARLQKDNVDLAHFLGNNFGDVRKELCTVAKEVLQSKYDLALAIERAGAANSLATEKVGAAVALAGEKQAAATALCCCETQAAVAASTAAVLAGIAASRQSETERLLTVFQVRAGLPGITPA